MVFEFLHNFGETLGFGEPPSVIPYPKNSSDILNR